MKKKSVVGISIILSVLLLACARAQTSAAPTIESCDEVGEKKDSFDLSERAYATGFGYTPSTTYDMYLVEDVTWVDGMAIPQRIAGTNPTVTSDGYGLIWPTLIWDDPLVAGKYDIVVDVDGDLLYYAETDALDDNDVEATAGFFVNPEPEVTSTIERAPGFSPGFWKHNIGVYRSENPGKYSAFEGGDLDGVKVTNTMLEDFAAIVEVSLMDAYAAVSAKGGPPNNMIRADMANDFNDAAGYGPFED